MLDDNTLSSPPPAGDSEKAEKYLGQLIDLIDQDKLKVAHTDLKKFDIATIEDHYRIDLDDYEVEVNHSKEPDSGQDFYVLLFNNLKKIKEGGESCVNKVILSYLHLTESQFSDFKKSADSAIEREKQREDAKRFSEAMAPIDEVLEKISQQEAGQREIVSQDEEQEEDLASFESPVELAEENQDINEEPKASDFQNQPQAII